MKKLSDKNTAGIHKEDSAYRGLTTRMRIKPTFFSRFIADIEKILHEEGSPGVKLKLANTKTNTKLLTKTNLLSTSPICRQRKIHSLYKYFFSLGLEVNLAKTKIIIFRRGGRVVLNLGAPFLFYRHLFKRSNPFKTKALDHLQGCEKQ